MLKFFHSYNKYYKENWTFFFPDCFRGWFLYSPTWLAADPYHLVAAVGSSMEKLEEFNPESQSVEDWLESFEARADCLNITNGDKKKWGDVNQWLGVLEDEFWRT